MAQAAYVLHRRDFQESSLLVDLLTRSDGRIRVVAKGAKRSKSTWRAVLQAFSPIYVEFSGRHDLKTLTLAEPIRPPLNLISHYLYSGFYLNELLQRLLPQYAEVTDLFEAYQQALHALAQKKNIEDTLRWFEWQLLQQLGHAFDWHRDAVTGVELCTAQYCYFDPERGLLLNEPYPGAEALNAAQVSSLDILNQVDVELDASQRHLGKKIMRAALAPHLGNKPLRSRELFKR